jgi:hypothetical protein
MNFELSEYQQALLNKQVSSVKFYKVGVKTTVALLTANNGFEIVGTSACVNPDDFNESIGQHFALVDALNELDGFIGFVRQQESFKAGE